MTLVFVGWCKDDNHDKVWGIVMLAAAENIHANDKYMVFWARRGSPLQTKLLEDTTYNARVMCRKKKNKGYNEVSQKDLHTVYPAFEKDIELATFWSMMKV